MEVILTYLKNRLDGNIYDVLHSRANDESKRVNDTNIISDLLFCKYDFEDPGKESILSTIAESYPTKSG